jgi:glycosyltransferase involved in cell wall biosynthesis
MPKLSIIVPTCNEIATTKDGVNVVQRTVQDIYEKATGDFEVIVGFGGPEYQDFPNYPNIRTLKLPESIGIKGMINALATMARGKYIYKTDAHCSFGKGFDEILLADMQDDWVVMPRFYVLNGKTWEWQDERHYDYFYLCCPFTDPRGFRFKAGGHWPQRTAEREDVLMDETPQIHGSGWLVNKEYYFEKLGGFPIKDPQGHAQEPAWLALRTWLMGGKTMVNKKTWYAHMHQDGSVKGYHYSREQERYSYYWTARHWMSDKEPYLEYNMRWFLEKFMPMPTWPEDWRQQLERYQNG